VVVRGELRAQIVETEAYRGRTTLALTPSAKTKMKNMVMFGDPGRAYIYFNYGVHWMLNIVAHGPGDGSAVLIRAANAVGGD